MKKNFLLLLLMTLLPMATWAQKPDGVNAEPVLAATSITWDGNEHALITTGATPVTGYNMSYTGGDHGAYSWYNEDPAGIQYYVQVSGVDPNPENGYDGTGSSSNRYRPKFRLGTHGVTTDWASLKATDVGTYIIWYRIMRDGNGPGPHYDTSDWVMVGTVTITPPSSTPSKPYFARGPQRIMGLVYNDEEQVLISMPTDAQYCPGYNVSAGGVIYVVKTEHAIPTSTEEATLAVTKIEDVKGLNAGTYYVYYKLLKDGGDYTVDGSWNEVGVGGIGIDKRPITEDDFTVTFKDGLIYNDADQDLLDPAEFVWTNGIDRATATAPLGSIKFIVDDEEDADGNSLGTQVDMPQGKNAGDYNIRVVIKGDGNHYNYMSAIDYATVTIDKATLTIVQEPAGYDNLVYNGTEQQLLEKGVMVEFDGVPFSTSRFYAKYTMNGVEYGGAGAYQKPKGTDADEDEDDYVITWEVTPVDVDNFNTPVGSGEVNVNIAKADWTLNTPEVADDWAYDGLEHSLLKTPLTATGKVTTDEADIKYYINDGEAIAEADVKAKDVDEYEVYYEIEATKNYNEVPKTLIGTVEVTKVKLHMGAQGVHVNYGDAVTYYDLIKLDMAEIPDTEPLKSDPEALKDALVQFVSFDGATIEAGKPTALPEDAGAYDFTLEPIEGNYEFVNFIPDGTLTIDKIDATPATVAAATLEYNGADQELVTIPDPTDADGGTMLYYVGDAAPVVPEPVDEFGEWSEEIPTGKDADTYTVWYVIKGDKNHNSGTPASIDVTIAQKPLDIAMFTFSDDDMTAEFTGEDLMPTFEAFDAVFGTTDENALAEEDYTVAMTDDEGDVEEMVNAGTYKFTFTAAADGNYSGEVFAEFVITPKPIDAADVEFALETEEVEYDGKDHQADVVVVPTEPLTEDDYVVVLPAEMINAGEYTITLDADAAGRNYSGTTTTTFTITKKALADEMFTLAPEDLEFNGLDQYASVALTAEDLNDEGDNIITDADFEETQIVYEYNGEVVTELINAGEYTFTYTATATGNYEGTATATISIAKIDANIYEPEKIDLTYDNTDQAPVTEGTTDAIAGAFDEPAGKVEYQILQGEDVLVDWTDKYADVLIKNAGDYTVNYKITASEVNYNNPLVEGSVDVTIEKAEISYLLGNITKDWDGLAFSDDEINSLFAINNGELFGGDKYDRPFDFKLKEDYRDAGTYDFSTAYEVVFKEGYPENYDVKVGGTGNIKINTVDIDAAYITAPEAIADLVYINGEAQDLVKAGEIAEEAANAEDYPTTEIAGKPFGTIVYATAEDGEYTEDVPQGTDAGDYEIWWKVVGDINHNDTDPVKIENTIAPNAIDFTLKFEDATETYTGEDFMPADVVAYDGETALEADKDYTLEITDDATELVNAGTYVFTYTGIGNYEGSTAEVTITIEPKALENKMITLSKTETEFNNEDQKPTYELKYNDMVLVEDVDFTVAADEEMIKGGEYQFTFTGIGNYCDNAEATFTIKKRVVIAQAENVEKVYNGLYGLNIEGGQVEVPITWGSLVPGDENVPVAGEGAITVEPYKKDFGKYAIIVDGSKFESDNYEVIKGDREAWLTITAADLTVKWASGAKASKVYGEADPDLAEYLDITGAVSAEIEEVRANTVITRSEGETVGSYDITLAAKAGAAVFGNYNVTFEGAEGVFTINKAPLTVTLAPQTATYTGEKADLGEIPSDQLVVNGLLNVPELGINDFKDVLTDIEVNIPDDAITVGDYEITLAGVAADNYECEFLPATLTIEPLEITTATLEAQKVQQGKKLDLTAFTAEGIPAVDAEKFYVAAPGLAEEDGTVTGDAGVYEKGLVLAVNADVADNYVLGEFTAELEIIAAETIILNDAEDIATTAQDGVNVTFSSRNVLQDNWNVLCLPFDVTVKQVSEAFGYAAVDLLNPEPSDGNMHFVVTTTGTITAGTPFIVKPTSDEDLGAVSNFDQITFYDVNVKAFSANPTPVADNGGNKFCGTFMAQTTFFGEKFWYMSKGMWKQASKFTEANPQKIGAYRAYIELASADARIFVEEPDGSITAINSINFNGNAVDADGWYTVNGMKLDAAPTQKGTYIQNGKKVIVK